MKSSRLISIFGLFMVAGSAWLLASTRISDFQARRENNAVVLEWTTESESNLARFEIERSTDRLRWLKIGETAASGESSGQLRYQYRDNTIFKAAVNNFYYRILMVDKGGQSVTYDVIVSVSGTSGIRHTWGSLKAMFR
jgi:hypothetical protein